MFFYLLAKENSNIAEGGVAAAIAIAIARDALSPRGGSSAPNVTIVAASPGSYMYLSPERPADSCIVPWDTGIQHTCEYFQIVNSSKCWYFNTYKYGLGGDPIKDTIPSVSSTIRNTTLLSRLFHDYQSKDFRLLLGELDVCACNFEGYQNGRQGGHAGRGCYPETSKSCGPNAHGGSHDGYACCDSWPHHGNELTSDCATNLQGSNRLQRGLNYLSHLRRFYARQGRHYRPVVGFFQSTHNSSAAFSSDAFRFWVFERHVAVA
eukprot:TRINITY_DN28466_c0_g3_i2.p1 TRINITY_DN28466_c0_g3~~TRINITY_DN28466_c0_g3_i2.p1  ORF type:complete len:264 (-),score=26.72 TRINITY_DN28466_c0_g3_i2:98-889(-)